MVDFLAKAASFLYAHGLRRVVCSPGARSAPLVLAFSRGAPFTHYIVPDERSAAYVALGMSLTSAKPTILLCTSGTAVLNYAPAVAEAFYQDVPLLLFTADRPPEWIDQQDGQSIRQERVYDRHVKASYCLPDDITTPHKLWYATRMIKEALLLVCTPPKGPVHVNVPLREPLYTLPAIKKNNASLFRGDFILPPLPPFLWGTALQEDLSKAPRLLVVAGQHDACASSNGSSSAMVRAITFFAETTGAVVVGDVTSNLQDVPHAISCVDACLLALDDPSTMTPDLLISFGHAFLSKQLKHLLRTHPPGRHWHVGAHALSPDTFQALSHPISTAPLAFFEGFAVSAFSPALSIPRERTRYQTYWQSLYARMRARRDVFLQDVPWGSLYVAQKLIRSLLADTVLHLANSMPVRYADWVGLTACRRVYANRGTNGIDGCLSTAVGAALALPGCVHVLLLGDMAFLYDRNALWQRQLPPNLKILLFNDHGGGIFRCIEGTAALPECEEFFVTHQPLTMAHTARQHGLQYFVADNMADFDRLFPVFMAPCNTTALLEARFKEPAQEKKLYEQFMRCMR